MDINYSSIKDNIDFVLSHFEGQHELFPRTIMTSETRGQVRIDYQSKEQDSKDRVFDYFRQAGFVDCKINAFPHNTEFTKVDFEVRNKTPATFIMVDLDLRDFGSREKLDRQLERTLKKMHLKFNKEAHPTVLWTGNGYHIYQPTDGMVFERYKVFHDLISYADRDLTTEFLRFAERFFTNGMSDPNHKPSIKSCLVRVPGTINSKNGDEVRIIQKWDGKKPAIQWVNTDFRSYLIQKRIDKIREKGRLKKPLSYASLNKLNNEKKIEWIENLLQIPIEDGRKHCLWRILCPYLVNIRRISDEESMTILTEWLKKCDNLRKMNFNSHLLIKNDLKHVGSYLPTSQEKLKTEQKELYNMFKLKNIVK